MGKVIMMCGLPASGKSTKAKELAIKHNAVIISSDDIRDELFGGMEYEKINNTAVFDEVHKRILQHLSNGEDVIFDATNINRKKRMHFINHVVRGHEVDAYYMNTSYNMCFLRNVFREKPVPSDVLKKMYKNFHVPLMFEGFDRITIDGNVDVILDKDFFETILNQNKGHDDVMSTFANNFPVINQIYNMPHDSSYHSFSISRHIYHVYDYINKHYLGKDKMMMMWSAIFHDVGKGFCKEFKNFNGEQTKYASFIGHENVSAQIAINYLRGLGYNDKFCLDVAEMVSLHMTPYNDNKRKVLNMLGQVKYEKLLCLHEADMSAK